MTTGLLAAHRTITSVPDFDDIETRLGVRAHTQGRNALQETQLEQGEAITGLQRDVDDPRRDVDQGFTEIREGFATLATGMAQITALLTNITGSARDGSHPFACSCDPFSAAS